MILTVCFLNCTAFSQLDSLHCFTTSQVQTFLSTKVELQNCLENYSIVVNERDSLTVENVDLTNELTSTSKKLKRNRKIAIIEGGVLAGIIALFIIIR